MGIYKLFKNSQLGFYLVIHDFRFPFRVLLASPKSGVIGGLTRSGVIGGLIKSGVIGGLTKSGVIGGLTKSSVIGGLT